MENISEEEAEIRMVEVNLQTRDDLLPSEKAWAYRIKLEAIKRQGERVDLTSGQTVGRFDSSCGQPVHKSRDSLSEESGRQVQRYIRLTYLLPPVLELVDNKSLPFGAGIELSYLREESQQLVLEYLVQEKKKDITVQLAQSLRELDENDMLSKQAIDSLLSPAPVAPKAVTIKMRKLKDYFAPTATVSEIENTIMQALKQYFAEVSDGSTS